MCPHTATYVSSYHYVFVLSDKPQCSPRHRTLRLCSYTHVRPISFYSPPPLSDSLQDLFLQNEEGKSEYSKVLSDACSASEMGLWSPFTEKDPLLEEIPLHSAVPPAHAVEHEQSKPACRVPLMKYESIHHVELFPVGAVVAPAKEGRRGGSRTGGTCAHGAAARMLLVGSRQICQGRACSGCSGDECRAATFDQYSTSSIAGRLHRNEATLSREDIYVNGSFKFDSINALSAAATPGMFRYLILLYNADLARSNKLYRTLFLLTLF